MTVAGATVMDINVDEGVKKIKEAIKQYLSERNG
jgi:cobalamin-dependent methionine synthase I